MDKLGRGRYELLVTEAVEHVLAELDERHVAQRTKLDLEELPDRFALHLAALIRRSLAAQGRERRRAAAIRVADELLRLLQREGDAVDALDRLSDRDELLLEAVARLLPNGQPETVPSPATPLLDTTLLTNAPGEPRVGAQLASEIPSADRIDVLMAFVRRSGIRPFLGLLQRHHDEGRALRLLTTTFTGSTELCALEMLRDAGAEIRVSYDTTGTRLHAKAWLFHRGSGFSTAYIGSSNLSHAAQVSGLEWNVRLSGARNPDVIEKFSAVFESYWQSDDFRRFDAEEFRERTASQSRGTPFFLSPIEVEPRPFQARLLEQIRLAREQGHHRNLLVAATGTGKTVMAALDYQHLRTKLDRARLLFVAHRKEILNQSLATFRHALRDAAFGELWVDGVEPRQFEHVFASIQSLTASGIAHIDPSHFDVLIVDEFHHAEARTYSALLEHLHPRELLGLTATPERGDGTSIIHWFDDRIAAELRLGEAIDQQYLCPFAYYGLHDGLDYREVTWRRGQGYDAGELTNLITRDHVVTSLILKQVGELVPDPAAMRALGFCVSVGHARFMAERFNQAGLAARAVDGTTPADERRAALKALADGELRVLFSVDLFNEGVDLPTVDTLLLLRPTDSPTLFLQQLGRGLRKLPDKASCTVLDFIGHHRKEFRFDRRLGAIIGGTRLQIRQQVEQGFPFLPSGCHMELDAVAREVVLDNLRQASGATFQRRVEELQALAREIPDPSLAQFIEHSGVALEDVYANNRSWSELRAAAGLPTLPAGPEETALRRALGRLLHVDDTLRIRNWKAFATDPQIEPQALPLAERRLFHMLAAVLLEKVDHVGWTLTHAANRLREHPQVLAELADLLDVLAGRIDHLQVPLATHADVPLQIHARYTRREILSAFAKTEALRLPEWREGVRWLPEPRVDLLAITLDKTGGHFSPTTRYRDYAINREMLHWESQSMTRAASPTGLRYREHAKLGSTILPFARLSTDDRAFWCLGPASYVRHEGELPMAITWQLAHPLPGDLLAQFAAAVA